MKLVPGEWEQIGNRHRITGHFVRTNGLISRRAGMHVARRVDPITTMMVALVMTWGTAFVAVKVLLVPWDPYQMTWFRYVPFLGIFGVWLLVRRRHRFREVTGNDWLRLVAMGAVGVIGYHFPLNWGLEPRGGIEVSGATGAILVATTPLWTLLFAVVLGQERFSGRKAWGSLVAFAGVAVVVFLGRGPGAELTLAKRALVILLAPMLWSLYSILAKPVIGRLGGLFVTGVSMCLGTLALLPLGILYGAQPLLDLTPSQLGWFLFLSLGATVAGYAAWNHALKSRSATEVTVYIYLIPVVATLVGWAILREAVTWWFAVGAAMVLWGVVMVNRARQGPQVMTPSESDPKQSMDSESNPDAPALSQKP